MGGVVAKWIVNVLMIGLLVVGLAKLIDAPAFLDALRTWTLVPVAVLPSLSIAIPLIELVLAGSWLLGLARRPAGVGALVMMSVFTLTYTAHVIFTSAPDCGCFAKLASHESNEQSWQSTIARNLAFIAIGGLSLRFCWRGLGTPDRTAARAGTGPAGRPGADSGSGRSPARYRGFTLLESLVVIAVLATVIAIALPALRGGRDSARMSVDLTRLRQHAGVVAVYSNDYRGVAPMLADPARPETAVFEGGGRRIEDEFFNARVWWHLPLSGPYYDGAAASSELFRSSTSPYPESYLADFRYACTLMSRPEFWRRETRTGPEQWGAVRLHEVAYPSAKGVFDVSYRLSAEVVLAADSAASFVDGHARSLRHADVDGTQYINDHRAWPGIEYVAHGGATVAHTIDGVRGRDLRGSD
ncbi:MAG: MauE/DoxX family redox-associated membrane protein [Planctomycetota bacterium]